MFDLFKKKRRKVKTPNSVKQVNRDTHPDRFRTLRIEFNNRAIRFDFEKSTSVSDIKDIVCVHLAIDPKKHQLLIAENKVGEFKKKNLKEQPLTDDMLTDIMRLKLKEVD